MRTMIMMTAAAAMVLGGLAPQTQARPRPRPGDRLTLTGYRVMVEPEIVEEFRGRLITRALHWKLRAVFVTPAGDEVLVHPRAGRRDGLPARDTAVRVDRRWERGDFPRESRLFTDYRKAKRRFDGLRKSTDITLLGEEVGEEVGVAVNVQAPGGGVGGVQVVIPSDEHPPGHHGVVDQPQIPPPPPAVVAPTCEQVLLELGHHPNNLDECRGVDQACAVTLLRKGFHPNLLDNCRGGEPTCAVQVLEAGHHPNNLNNCTFDLSPGCVTALLRAGHHPNLLDNCRGVDDVCAETLLRQGRHPNLLDNCRRGGF